MLVKHKMVSPPARSLKVCLVGSAKAGKTYVRESLQDISHIYSPMSGLCISTYTSGYNIYNLWDLDEKYVKKYVSNADRIIIFGDYKLDGDNVRYVPDIKEIGADTLLMLIQTILEEM